MYPLVPRLLPTFLVLVLAAPLAVQAQVVGQAEGIEPDKSQLQLEEALLARIWWNQASKIQTLGLSQTQRDAMNEAFRPFIRNYNERHQQIQQERKAFSSAVYESDMDEAEALHQSVVNYQSEFISKQIVVMMDIAKLMTEEQLALLGEQFPALFSRAWIRPFRPGARDARQGLGH
ncbi:MAG: hypothetical protein AAGI11_06455 [Pseudomonadota bacterium]